MEVAIEIFRGYQLIPHMCLCSYFCVLFSHFHVMKCAIKIKLSLRHIEILGHFR